MERPPSGWAAATPTVPPIGRLRNAPRGSILSSRAYESHEPARRQRMPRSQVRSIPIPVSARSATSGPRYFRDGCPNAMDNAQVRYRRCRSAMGDVRPGSQPALPPRPGRARHRPAGGPDGRDRRLRAGEHRRPGGDRQHPQRRPRRERQERLLGGRSGRAAGAVPAEQRAVDPDLPLPGRERHRDPGSEQPAGRPLVCDPDGPGRRRQLPLSRSSRCRRRRPEPADDRDRRRGDAERRDPADRGRRRGLDRAAGLRGRQRHRPGQPQLQRQCGGAGNDEDERQRHRQRLGDLQRRRHGGRGDGPQPGRLPRPGRGGLDDTRPGRPRRRLEHERQRAAQRRPRRRPVAPNGLGREHADPVASEQGRGHPRRQQLRDLQARHDRRHPDRRPGHRGYGSTSAGPSCAAARPRRSR